MKRYILAAAMASLLLSTASFAQGYKLKNSRSVQSTNGTGAELRSLSSGRARGSYDMLDRSKGPIPSVIERMPFQPGSAH